MRAVALIDGEHYPPVVRDALRALPYEWVGAILVGGTEKLRGGAATTACRWSTASTGAEIVVDLSDEPVLGPAERFRWVSRALAAGLPYVGADFRFDPPSFEPFELPSIAVIGTGKRVGKTAVTAHLARLLARDRDVVVVAMGRGGPPEPEVVERPPTRRRPRRALARRPACRVGPPRARCAHRRARRSAAAARAAGSPAPSSSRTSPRARASPRRVGPTSSSSTAAARRSRRSTSTARVLVVGAGTTSTPT